MKTISSIIISLFLFSFGNAQTQTSISGKVTDKAGEPLVGANIFIEGSFEGTSANSDGTYQFTTNLTSKQILRISFIGFIEQKIELELNGTAIVKNFKLKMEANELNAVVITAGAFEASDKKKGVTLKPLDIVTTPSAEGDIYGALKTLPGAQTVGEDGRLFVRGGDSYESKTFIDGMLVQQPYTSKLPDIPARGRFSPFLFTGTLFSSGGYSAEYGQALSSALILNTNALPEESVTNLSFLSVGAGVGHTQRWDKASFGFNYDYTNLGAYHKMFNTQYEWDHSPTAHSGLITARKKVGKTGMWKLMSNMSSSRSALFYPSYNATQPNMKVDQTNDNIYLNSIYNTELGKDWSFKAGISFTYDNDDQLYGTNHIDENMIAGQVKINFSKKITNGVKLKFGTNHIIHQYAYDYKGTTSKASQSFQLHNPSLFAESEIQLPAKLAMRIGFRADYANLNKETKLSPRLSLAYKLNEFSQFSFAYGDFYQSPKDMQLIYKNSLSFEKAQHFIANYQWKKGNHTFRVEAYQKAYNNLVKYSNEFDPNSYNNRGDGHARGIDVFWRSTSTKSNLDYWIAYSYIDSKRDYLNFPEKAQPNFISNHNLSVVAKKFITAINTQFGMSYTLSSGRPYENPMNNSYLADRTPFYSDLSLNFSHLFHIKNNFSILYFSVSNLLGRKNVYSYRYSKDAQGNFTAHELSSDLKRMFVLALFVKIQ